jgi:RHS repeat-associated protein
MKKYFGYKLLLGLSHLMIILSASAQKFNRPNIPGPNGIQVNSFNGNIFHERQDHYLPGSGFPLNMAFSYNGLRDALDFGYGRGWTLAYNLYYERDSADNVVMVRGDGRRDVFSAEETGFVPPAGVFDFLEEYETGKLRLTTKSGIAYFFEDAAHKRLTKINDTNNNELVLAYESGRPVSIANSAGRSLTLAWENDRLKEVTDASISPARKFQYKYNAEGYLTQVTDPLGGIQKYAYNEQGQMTEMTDKNGQATSLIYNENTIISQICSPISTLTLKYNPERNQTFAIEEGSSGNQVTTYTFNKVGNLIRKKGSCCGFDVQYEYDEDNNIREMTDANGNVTEYTYDERGNLISEKDALGNQTIYRYESTFNRLVSVTDANGNTVTNSYDGQGNLTTVALPEGITLAYSYDQNGNITSAIDGKGNTTSFEYDGLGNVVKTIYPSGEENYTYDNAGNMLSLRDINRNTLVFTYDGLDRLTKLADPLGNEVNYEYDGNGNLIQETDPNGTVKTYGYDALNRLKQVTTPAGTTTYTYDQLGNLTSIKDANGKVNTYTYNSLNLLASETDGAGFTTSYEYDGNGNMIAKITPNGAIIEYAYDALGQLIRKKYGETEDVFAYDALGNLANAANKSISYRYAYDGLNRLVSKSATNWQKTIRYSYDSNGNRSTMTDPDGGITRYTYDADNRLTQLQNPFGETFRFMYDGTGRITRQDNGNGTYTTFTYDNAGRLKELANHDAGGGIISRHAYTYDANGNRLSMDSEEGTHSYSYDGDNRLLTVDYADGSTESFTYDATGNRISKTTDGTTTNYTYDEGDRLLTANGITFGFDANGNLLEKNESGKITRYSYDPENRLIGVTLPDGRTINYAYDPFGDRISKTTPDGIETRYLLDGNNVLQELDRNNNLVAQYTATEVMDSWLGMHRNGQNYTYHQDGLNSTMALTSATGNIINAYRYEAYGKLKGQTINITNPYTYTGRELDPIVDLYYYRTRYYEAGMGRFLVKDFFQGFMERPMSINKYGYVEGSPINYIDPNGKAIPVLILAGRILYKGFEAVKTYRKVNANYLQIIRSLNAFKKSLRYSGLRALARNQHFKYLTNNKFARAFRSTSRICRRINNKIGDLNDMLSYNPIEALKSKIHNKIEEETKLLNDAISLFEEKEENDATIGEKIVDRINSSDCGQIFQGVEDLVKNIINKYNQISLAIITAVDPNDILGPTGYGPEKWVSANENLDYTIRFENDPDFATAAARNVFIDMPVNANADRGSFRVGNYGFGSFRYETPESRSYFERLLDVRDSLGVVVNYVSGLDVTENKGFWIFNSVDPITRLEPSDARLGFLPVNDSIIGNGEGYVNFSMRASREAVTGDTLFAQASIVFDEEAPIITNNHFNTIDADAPVSLMEINSVDEDSVFVIHVQAADVGSGHRRTELFYSVNGAPLQLLAETFASDTTLSFSALPDSTYCFVSIAEDNVGNLEEAKPINRHCLVLAETSPVFSGFSPNRGWVGDTVTVTGENLELVNNISLNGVAVNFTLLDSATIEFTVPEGATTGKIRLDYEEGEIESMEDFTMDLITSVPEEINYSFTVYPNPGSGIFIVETNYHESDSILYKVHDPTGKTVLEGEINGDITVIDIRRFPNGMYFIYLLTNQGRYVTKVIKQ